MDNTSHFWQADKASLSMKVIQQKTCLYPTRTCENQIPMDTKPPASYLSARRALRALRSRVSSGAGNPKGSLEEKCAWMRARQAAQVATATERQRRRRAK